METQRQLHQFSEQMMPYINSIQNQFMEKIQTKHIECTNKAGQNEDKFVECMQKLSERSEKALKNLEYRLIFWRHSTYNCFNGNNADLEKCKSDAKTKIEEYFKDSFKEI